MVWLIEGKERKFKSNPNMDRIFDFSVFGYQQVPFIHVTKTCILPVYFVWSLT